MMPKVYPQVRHGGWLLCHGLKYFEVSEPFPNIGTQVLGWRHQEVHHCANDVATQAILSVLCTCVLDFPHVYGSNYKAVNITNLSML